MKKTNYIVFVIIVIIALGGIIFSTNRSQVEQPGVENQLVGNDTDDKGCLGSAGYSWCEAKQKCLRVFEEFCPDKVTQLINDIKVETGVGFFNPQPARFNWMIEGLMGGVEIEGIKYSFPGTTTDQQKVTDYLGQRFEIDKYNQADGPGASLTGFTGEYMACNLLAEATMVDSAEGPLQRVGDTVSLGLSCGYFNKNDLLKYEITSEVKQLFMKKYNKPSEEVRVTVNDYTDTHMAGSVKFGLNGIGEGGIVFATKKNGQWKLVFDGNGGFFCDLLKAEGFPESMQTGCN